MTGMRDKYAAAGVDVSAKDEFIEAIREDVKATHDARVLGGLGLFGGFFSAKELKDYDDPVLVGCTDGIGTKIKWALEVGDWGLKAVGVDLVAMCVNDLITSGAKPLFFLDYYASSKLDPAQAGAFLKGVADGCQQAGCPLIGGETAQMPGLYRGDDFDAAGFCVGVVERREILGPDRCEPGLSLLGLASSGFHSNGYSLVRKHFEGPTPELLAPTKIYVSAVLSLIKQHPGAICGIANITGGGLHENIPRMLPSDLQAVVKLGSWPVPEIIQECQRRADLSDEELLATFNGGLGMVLAVRSEAAAKLQTSLEDLGQESFLVGETGARPEGAPAFLLGKA